MAYMVPLEGLGGSFWLDIRRVESWHKHKGSEVQGTSNWLHNCSF